MTRSVTRAAIVAVLLLPAGVRAQAQAPAPSAPPAEPRPRSTEDEAEQKKLEEQIAKELGAAPGAATSGQAAPPARADDAAAAAAGGARGGNPLARLLLMPDLSAIGSVAAAWNSEDVAGLSPRPGPFAPKDKLQFQFEELELGLQAVVDPYVRADVFISFAREGVSVEEAYVTSLGLPAGLQLKAGQFFTPFGRLNTQHPHTWDFIDAPLAKTRLVADDVLSGPGASLGWLLPVPWYLELTGAAQSTAPDAADPTDRLTATARLATWLPLSDTATLGLGASASRRDAGAPGRFRDLAGADAYLRIRPLASRSYLALSGEYQGRRFTGAGASLGRSGWWAQAFWRQDAWWGYGVRFEDAPAARSAALDGRERRASAVATWFATEFQRIRLQASYDRLPGARNGVEALVQLEFGIGAHGAHPF